MNIYFYLNNEEQTPITNFLKMPSNPFNLNDVVSLNVEKMQLVDCIGYKEEIKKRMIESNEKAIEVFKHKKIKLVKECKFITIETILSSEIIIEYFCEIVEE